MKVTINIKEQTILAAKEAILSVIDFSKEIKKKHPNIQIEVEVAVD